MMVRFVICVIVFLSGNLLAQSDLASFQGLQSKRKTYFNGLKQKAAQYAHKEKTNPPPTLGDIYYTVNQDTIAFVENNRFMMMGIESHKKSLYMLLGTTLKEEAKWRRGVMLIRMDENGGNRKVGELVYNKKNDLTSIGYHDFYIYDNRIVTNDYYSITVFNLDLTLDQQVFLPFKGEILKSQLLYGTDVLAILCQDYTAEKGSDLKLILMNYKTGKVLASQLLISNLPVNSNPLYFHVTEVTASHLIVNGYNDEKHHSFYAGFNIEEMIKNGKVSGKSSSLMYYYGNLATEYIYAGLGPDGNFVTVYNVISNQVGEGVSLKFAHFSPSSKSKTDIDASYNGRKISSTKNVFERAQSAKFLEDEYLIFGLGNPKYNLLYDFVTRFTSSYKRNGQYRPWVKYDKQHIESLDYSLTDEGVKYYNYNARKGNSVTFAVGEKYNPKTKAGSLKLNSSFFDFTKIGDSYYFLGPNHLVKTNISDLKKCELKTKDF